jgi:hypothetical protein
MMMTFSSVLCRVIEGQADERVAELNIQNHGTAELAAWASETGIESGRLTWIDECWLKISLGSHDAALYLDKFLEPELARPLKAGLEPSGTYTIEVEEPF